MRRRNFLALVGGTAVSTVVRPVAPRAQQGALPVVAFINGATLDASGRFLAMFRKGLSETGYVEGRNVTVEYHWLDGHYETVPGLLADMIRRRVAVLAMPGAT